MQRDTGRADGRSWRAAVAAAAVVAVVTPLFGPLRFAALGVAQLAGAALLSAAVLRYRPALPAGWWLLAGAAAAAGAGQTYGALDYRADAAIAFPSPTDLLFLAHLTLLGAALAVMLRGRTDRPRGDALLDAAIGSAGSAAVMWAFVASPVLRAGDQGLPAQVVSSAYGIGHLVVAGLVVRFRFGTPVRTAFARLLTYAVAARLAGDILAFAQVTATGERLVGAGVLALWGLWALLPVAAAAHPSAREPAGYGRGGGHEPAAWMRTVALVTVGCPVVTVAGYLLADPGDPITAVELVAPVALLTVLSLLLVARAGRSAALARRRADQLDRQTQALDVALREQRALRAELEHRALHDPLTGLGNRTLLTERVAGALHRGGRHAFLLIDLDGFKEVNDGLGHPAGDGLLVAFADRLREAVPGRRVLARLGGDEFAVLLEDVPAAAAHRTADAVCRALSQPYAVDGHQVTLTTSIGLLAIGPGTTVAAALRDADVALYAAKGRGKNRVVAFTPELRRGAG